MPNWLGISAVALLGFVGGPLLSGCKLQHTAAARFPFAFVHEGCGPTDGYRPLSFISRRSKAEGGRIQNHICTFS